MSRIVQYLLCFILAASLFGCGSNSTTPAAKASSITINPGSATVIYNGGQQQFSATALDSGGNIVHPTLSWSIDNSSAGTINSSTGLFTAGVTKGATAKITCQADGITTTATVTVGGMANTEHQFVNDIQSTAGYTESLLSPQVNQIGQNTNDQVLPALSQIRASLTQFFGGVDFSGFFSASSVQSVKQVNKSVAFSVSSHYGIQEQDFNDNNGHSWHRKTACTQSGSNDVLTFTLTSSDPHITYHPNYQGSFTYPTALATTSTVSGSQTLSLSLNLKNDYLTNATFNGYINTNVASSPEDSTVHLNGTLEFYFVNNGTLLGNYLKFTGDINLQHNTLQTDSLTGTLETADVKLSGAIYLSYAANSYSPSGIYPLKLILDGKIQSQSNDPCIMEGRMTFEAKNAATFNPDAAYSASNFISGIISFNGSVQSNSLHKVEETLSFEETGYKLYRVIYQYKLTTGEASRNIKVTISNSDDYNLRIDIYSSWGPVFLRMDCIYSSGILSNLAPDTVNGNIYVNKDSPSVTPDATVTKEGASLVIHWADHTTETL